MLMWMMLLIFMIPLILMILNLFMSKKEWLDREKIISFECGFDSMSSSRLPFSIHFYLISILFLVFDIETVFLFPLIDLYNNLDIKDWMFISFLIILILFLGLEFEKKEGSLKWFF